ncbi:MAG: hypothetical protein PHE20_00250 [Patescibacteria group bacterium]|nr:hypothetical protein [Patescibacteria group bacterium]
MKKNIIFKEFFYFFSALLALAFLVEIIFPGLFILYFNLAFLTVAWLISALLTLLYVRQ